MRVRGKVRKGKVVVPEGVKLPEGTEVEVVCREDKGTPGDWVRRAEQLRRRIGGLGVSVIELIRHGRRL